MIEILYKFIMYGGPAVLGLICSFIFLRIVMQMPTGQGKQVEISNIIKYSSFVYLKKQYSIIWPISALLLLVVYYIFGVSASICFAIGVASSSASGFYNMFISVNGNVRTVEGAKTGLGNAFKTAMYSGLSASMYLNALGILSVYISLLFGNTNYNLIALSMGASLVSVFARLGGGIFTKGADVGADMVGKIQNELPEDDPRNPAVIADNVGDNVGDCAGMSADLLESYVVSLASAVIITQSKVSLEICGLGLIASFIPVLFMKFKEVWKEMDRYFITSSSIFLVLSYILCYLKRISIPEFGCIATGIACVVLILKITEYYTSQEFSPVQEVAKASTFGSGTNVIYGIAIGFQSVVLPLIVILFGMLLSFKILGVYGITISIVGIVALSPAILVLDIFGPISDNAGGIAEMSGLPSSIREITDELDAVGNTTKAITKGYAIGSAIFASVVMFYLFQRDLIYIQHMNLVYDLGHPYVICGLFFGSIVPFWFSGISMKSVGKAASSVVDEVRRQINENPGILKGTSLPDYKRAIELLTSISIKEMIFPALLPILFPIIAYCIGLYLSSNQSAFIFLSATIIGVTIIGSFLSIFMVMAGGLWDNSKKYIESGVYGGKGSEAHKAAVTGDTVGDPFKDTSGPSLNSVIKLANLIGILMIYIIH